MRYLIAILMLFFVGCAHLSQSPSHSEEIWEGMKLTLPNFPANGWKTEVCPPCEPEGEMDIVFKVNKGILQELKRVFVQENRDGWLVKEDYPMPDWITDFQQEGDEIKVEIIPPSFRKGGCINLNM